MNQSLQKNKAIQPHQVGVDWGDTDDDEDLNEDKCILDENGSLMEVDELDTAALDRKCNNSLFVDNHSFSVKNWGAFKKPTKIWVFHCFF